VGQLDPKATIKWPDGQPADAWHIRPYYITAERRPFRNAEADIGQSGGSAEVIDVTDTDDDEICIVQDGEAPPPAPVQLTEAIEIDELDSVVSAPLAQGGNKFMPPARRLLEQLNSQLWPTPQTPPQLVQQSPFPAKSPISVWATEVRKQLEQPIELDNAVQVSVSTPLVAPVTTVDPPVKQIRPAPVSPEQAHTPSSTASPGKPPNGGPTRLERSAQRSTLHGRIQRLLYNAGLQFNKLSESMTTNEAKDHGDGAFSDSLKSASGIEPLQSKELDINPLRPLFDAANLQGINEELALLIAKINTAVKALQSDHQFLTTRERMFALKKEALNKKAAGLRDEHSKRIVIVEFKERALQDRIKEIQDSYDEKLQDAIKRNEELYIEKVALLDAREMELEDREAEVEVRENAVKDLVDEMTDPMECDEGFEDAVERMTEG